LYTNLSVYENETRVRSENNQIVVLLPDSFEHQKSVWVTVEDTDPRQEKLLKMASAAKDPLFLADIQTVQEDFKNIDFEIL